MVYKIKLKVRDEERWLTSIEYGYRIKFSDVADIDKIIQLHQEVSAKLGSEEPLPLEGGLFRLRFSSTDHDQFFYDWMFVSAMEDGSIEILQNEVETVSRISFWDCYCVGIEEWMSVGGAPMGIELLLSPAIMKKDALVYEKIWKVSDIHGNTEEVKAETKKETPKPAAPPTPLITAVTGKTSALPNTIVEYKVTSYNIPNVSSSDKARIKWIVKVEDKEFSQTTQGETLKLTIDESWMGKDIVVMPYLKKYTPKVSVKTEIRKKILVLFIGGAADKNSFYGMKATNIIKTSVKTEFDINIKAYPKIDCESLYLGFDEIFRDEHVNNLMARISPQNMPLFIVGHSLGGWNGAHLSTILVNKGFNVKMLVTLDPVGEGGIVWAISDIHYEIPSPKADFWINISAVPNNPDKSDLIAGQGERWYPKIGPNINHITTKSHWNVGGMFKEIISKDKSALNLLIEHITK